MKVNASIKPRNKTQKLFDETSQLVDQAKRLARQGRGYEIATDIRRALRRIEPHDFNRLAADLSGFLQYHYFFFAHDRKRGELYHEKRKEYAHLAFVEEELIAEYARLVYKLRATSKPDKSLRKELEDAASKADSYKSYNNIPINIVAYSLLVLNADAQNNPNQCICYCREIIDFMMTRKVNRTLLFHYYLVPLMIEKGEYEEAEAQTQIGLNLTRAGSQDYARFRMYQIVNCFHAGKYQEGYRLFCEMSRVTEKLIAEQYRILKGYIYFLMQTGHIDGKQNFRLGKMLNEIPIFDKDKAGYNLNVIILHYLYHLGRQNGRIIDSFEAVDRYRRRHLIGRENIFIKMLQKISTYKFNPIAVENRVRDDVKELEKYRCNVTVEIIPFKKLWEMIVKLLQSKVI